jgi:tripartite-type tricarboxylate transporter receptor subunit TctC
MTACTRTIHTAATMQRRQFLHLAGTAALMPTVPRLAWAQDYPGRPVHLIIGFPAGGFGDIVARLVGQGLQERLGQPFVVENRPGAGSNLAAETVVRASPDGYTLLVVTAANAVNATFYDKLDYEFSRDIAPVAGLVGAPYVMTVHPAVPARTVPEFIAYAKANPGKINMASAGNGSSLHMSGELFKMMTGVDMLHVPYRGEPPAINDVIAGQAQVVFASMPGSISHIRAGKLRALAVTTAKRSPALPDIPPLGESVPGYEVDGWIGIGAPKGTPPDIVDRLNKAMSIVLADPKLKARIGDLGGAPLAGSPSDFGKLIAAETAKWAKVVKFSGAKPS